MAAVSAVQFLAPRRPCWVSACRSAADVPSAPQHPPAATAAAGGTPSGRRPVVCSAATQENRGQGASSSSSNGSTGQHAAGSRSWSGSRGAHDPLLRRILECSTERQMHQLLLAHSGELGGLEVAAALEVTAKCKLLQTSAEHGGRQGGEHDGSAGSSGGGGSAGGGSPLALLLVELASRHAASMDPGSLSAAAWSLAALDLAPARPVMRSMHDLALTQLVQFSPSQLCALLWAGGSLDPSFRSPLFRELQNLMQQGMSLALFSADDLAALAFLCGREGGGLARDVMALVAAECVSRVDAYKRAREQEWQGDGGAAATAAGKTKGMEPGGAHASGVTYEFLEEQALKWTTYEMSTATAAAVFGARMSKRAISFQMQTIKEAVKDATRGEVLREVVLEVCGQEELNPRAYVVSVSTRSGRGSRLLEQPLDSYHSMAAAAGKGDQAQGHWLSWRLLSHGLGALLASSDLHRRWGGTGTLSNRMPAVSLPAAEVQDVLRECAATAGFWEAVCSDGHLSSRAAKTAAAAAETGSASASVVALTASGRRLRLTWQRQGERLLPYEVEELAPDPVLAAAVAEAVSAAAQAATEAAAEKAAKSQEAKQRRRQTQQGDLPPPPFNTRQAAMLLSGMARLKYRTGGLVEPMLQQCEPLMGQARAEDVARILMGLADLQMDIATELLAMLQSRISSGADALTPQQMVGVLWATTRGPVSPIRLSGTALRHFDARQAEYSAVDVVGLLWACAHWSRLVPDKSLQAALKKVAPALSQLSTSALSHLTGALGKVMSSHCGMSAISGGRTPRNNRWLALPASVLAAEVVQAAARELAQRCPRMKPHELAAAARGLAAHEAELAVLPAAAVAAVRAACTAAAAADEFAAHDLGQLATAAARMRWTDLDFLDALVLAVRSRVLSSACLNEVFTEVVLALATLAPARYAQLFNSLALSFAHKYSHWAEDAATLVPPFEPTERANLLTAFAVVAEAQALPRSTLIALLNTVRTTDARRLHVSACASMLSLAARAHPSPHRPLVEACCLAVQAGVGKLSLQALRQARSSLAQLRYTDAAVLAAISKQVAALEASEAAAAASNSAAADSSPSPRSRPAAR